MIERLQRLKNLKNHLSARILDHQGPDTREFHQCHQVGHIARNCTQKKEGAPNGNTKLSSKKFDLLGAHKSAGHIFEICSKSGHMSAQCWTAHPELIHEVLVKKRGTNGYTSMAFGLVPIATEAVREAAPLNRKFRFTTSTFGNAADVPGATPSNPTTSIVAPA